MALVEGSRKERERSKKALPGTNARIKSWRTGTPIVNHLFNGS
jgi:hypothetical protein